MKSKEVKDLMEAYASIYMEQEQLVEGAEEYAGGQHPSKHPDKKVRDRYETETRRRQAPKGVGVPDKSVGYGQLQQSVDLFDIVKGYLIDEGATEEEVYDMMAHLTDEQRDAIIEQGAEMAGRVPQAAARRPSKAGSTGAAVGRRAPQTQSASFRRADPRAAS